MTELEIKAFYQVFSQKVFTEDIVNNVKVISDKLISSHMHDEVAVWALTYLLDDQDLIHDELSVLGWQDDWMVLDAARKIIA